MFTFRQFDNVIFDMNKALQAEFCSWVSSYAGYLETTTGRPIFSPTRAALLVEVKALNTLMPTTKAALIAAMTIIPADYKDNLADRLLGVK